MAAALDKQIEVMLYRWILEHVAVHGRCNEDGFVDSQKKGGEGIIGDAVGEFADDVGGGRGHHEGVRPVRHTDVLDLQRAVGIEHVGV